MHGPYFLYFEYTDIKTKCKNVDAMGFSVQQLPEISIVNTLPIEVYLNQKFPTIETKVKYAIGQTWSSDGDGTFNDVNLASTLYKPGNNDYLVGKVNLTITVDPRVNDKCPEVKEVVPAILYDTVSSVVVVFSKKNIKLYPNPVPHNQPFNVKMSNAQIENATIKLFDISGKVIPITFKRSNNLYQINPIGIKGEFILEIKVENQKAFRKIVVY